MSRPEQKLHPAKRDAVMRRCIELAKQGWGKTHPNPMVGAAIVEAGDVVAEGFHSAAGNPHAEIEAFTALGRKPKTGAILFVTLEPCSTQGRTPPCTQAIIDAGIKYVVVGAPDPNPDHAGRGLEILKAAGITVETHVLERECEDLNLIFNHWITTGKPLIAAKFATTIDGRIATRTGESKWITGPAARADVMKWRRLFPAIAVGAGTAMADQPRLTARIEGEDEWCPIRFVFDGLLRTAMDRDLPSLFTDEFRANTIVVTSETSGTGYHRRLESEGVRVWVLPGGLDRASFSSFRERCATEGITGVYVEGGAQILSEMFRARAIDYSFAYRAPILFADDNASPVLRGLRTLSLDKAIRLERVHHAHFGDDQLMRGYAMIPSELSIDEAAFSHR